MLFPLASQVDALLIEKCEAWYERRGIPVRKLGSVKAALTVAEKWEQLLGFFEKKTSVGPGTAVWLEAKSKWIDVEYDFWCEFVWSN